MLPSASRTSIVTTTEFAEPGDGSLAETTTTCAAGPARNATVPGISAIPVAEVSVRLTVTSSATLSLTATVIDPVPSGIEIEIGRTPADPVTATFAV